MTATKRRKPPERTVARPADLNNHTVRLDKVSVATLDRIAMAHDRDRSWSIRWLCRNFESTWRHTADVDDDVIRCAEPAPTRPQGPLERSELAFDVFWRSCPRKVGKGAALSVWLKLKAEDRTAATAGMAEYGVYMANVPEDRVQYIPHPATWLRQRRWEDDRAQWKRFAGQAGAEPPEPWKPRTKEDQEALERARLDAELARGGAR